MATRSETLVTTPKLHPAAIRAAKEWADYECGEADRAMTGEEMDEMKQNLVAETSPFISNAIDDHLKSEGWVDLVWAIDRYRKELNNPIPDPTLRRVYQEQIFAAVRRVRGEKP